MSTLTLQPGDVFPTLSLPKLGGGTITLGRPEPQYDWQMVVVYGGKHCPICTKYLDELNQVLPELHQLNIDVVAVSADSQERANSQIAEVNPDFPVGYDLSIDQMKQLGLFVSGPNLGMGAERPFAEPGLFVINDEGNLQMIDISNVPFARPRAY